MIQTIVNKACFHLLLDNDKNILTYLFNDNATCTIWPNESDIAHGKNLGLTGMEHKLLHEITHNYVAECFGLACCPIVYAEAHKEPLPSNAEYLEEIIFSMVYFTKEKEMLYNNWFGYLDRLHGKINLYDLKNRLLNITESIKSGKLFVTL